MTGKVKEGGSYFSLKGNNLIKDWGNKHENEIGFFPKGKRVR